jgi:hypothetical protein
MRRLLLDVSRYLALMFRPGKVINKGLHDRFVLLAQAKARGFG